MQTSRLQVQGLDCPVEEKLIRKQLDKLEGVIDIECNFIAQELIIKHQLDSVTPIIESIAQIGMQATSIEQVTKTKNKFNYWRLAQMLSAGLLALAAEIIAYATGDEQSWLVILLAGLTILLVGGPCFKKAYIAIKQFSLNIYFLMSLAIVCALLIKQWPEAAMVTFLFALAELLERYSLDKARNAIAGLMALVPEQAMLKTDAGWVAKLASEIKIGDIVLVKPAERIALDGVILTGNSKVDQAPVTGESALVNKTVGDNVFAGTINQHGSFEFQVSALSSNSVVAQIIHQVEQAQAKKAQIQRTVDKFTRVYTPIMMLLALLIAIIPPLVFAHSFSIWFYKALVILVIACPCALVLSTPISIVSALALAARKGILIKGGVYLENGKNLKIIAFDKTGTLTCGKPQLTDVIPVNEEIGKLELLQIAASLEGYSEHPIAHALLAAYQKESNDLALLMVSDFLAIPGRGVEGKIGHELYFIGNHQLIEERQMCSPRLEEILQNLEQEAKTTMVLATQSEVLGVFAIADALRQSSALAVSKLHQLGLMTVMLTGDNQLTANAIAKQVGIDLVYANLLPEQKLLKIDQLVAEHHYVAMVGDGINDAPALAKANIGFALGHGATDIALETADVVLLGDNLTKLVDFINLSRRSMRVLKQNITLAIGIKIIFLILALTGNATLWMAVFADMGASLIVVLNGLRLLRMK